MADSSAAPSSAPRSGVVRSLARAADRPCARPGCPAPARATLTFSYATAEVHLDRLAAEVDPQGYDLCARHATRTEAPRGWGLTDRRPADDRLEDEPPAPPARDLGSDATVAVLAAALRAVPEAGSAPAPVTPVVVEPAPAAPARPSSAPPASPAEAQASTEPRRRRVVETLLSEPAAAPADRRSGRRDTRDDPTVELPRLGTPRRVPAAGDRGPATDW